MSPSTMSRPVSPSRTTGSRSGVSNHLQHARVHRANTRKKDCNSTGVYAGVGSGGNFTEAPENLNNTFLRGFQLTDDDGAVQFLTTYPGHYSGRTQHIHVAVHPNATARDNGTIYDLTANHVGQLYFDQDLSDAVEVYSPYNTNTQPITTNEEDFLLLDGLATSDPIVQVSCP